MHFLNFFKFQSFQSFFAIYFVRQKKVQMSLKWLILKAMLKARKHPQ